MRNLSVNTSNLTRHIKDNIEDFSNISRSEGILVKTYRDLVKEVAELSYLNQDYLLFFRGQAVDYKNKNSTSTIYPSIYREERLTKNELKYKFDVLNTASVMLVNKLENKKIIGNHEIKRKKQIQWSILQHYEVCPTPFLDVTHSLRVACSFAMLNRMNDFSYIYVLALPYITGRISINSEYDLINIRLLSISPPQALRPFFQEGYLVGTEFICDEYENKTELDFNRRLLAKYKIPNNNLFWEESFNKIDETLLYPDNDIMLDICNEIKNEIDYRVVAGNETIGSFLFKWSKLEEWLRKLDGGQYNIIQGLKYLKYNNLLGDIDYNKVDAIRKFRNKVVHEPNSITSKGLLEYDALLEDLLSYINQYSEDKISVG